MTPKRPGRPKKKKEWPVTDTERYRALAAHWRRQIGVVEGGTVPVSLFLREFASLLDAADGAIREAAAEPGPPRAVREGGGE